MRTVLMSGALGLFLLMGCGGGDDRGTAFIGPWTYERGHLECRDPGVPDDLGELTGRISVTETDPTHVRLTMASGCDVDFALSPDYTATAVPRQTCQLQVPALGTRTLTIDAWDLEVDNPSSIYSMNTSGQGYAYFVDKLKMVSNGHGTLDGCSTLIIWGQLLKGN